MRNLPMLFLAAIAAVLPACVSEAGSSDAAPAAGDAAAASGAGGAAAAAPAETPSAPQNPEASNDPMTETPAAETVYAGSMKDLSGSEVDLAQFRGKVVLFVNVASQCGYTPQYAGLQKLQEELGGDAFTVVGVPSNDFGRQEPGSAEEIQEFCSTNYGVTFPMMEKVETKGAGAAPLYAKLAAMTGESPGWNFCKYLVSKDGTQAKFFKSGVKPDSAELRDAIRGFME